MNKALCFIFGAIAGTALGYYIARQRCEEEIESVKEAFREDSEREESSVDENPDREPIDPSVRPAVKEAIDYLNIVRKAGYSIAPDPTDDDEDISNIPYEITPNEFGDIEYEEVELVMFADDVLADGDTYERVEDVDNVVGEDNLLKFGHYEEDRVCVRNDRLKCDYEIIRDERTYEQAYKTMYPYKPYDEDVED